MNGRASTVYTSAQWLNGGVVVVYCLDLYRHLLIHIWENSENTFYRNHLQII